MIVRRGTKNRPARPPAKVTVPDGGIRPRVVVAPSSTELSNWLAARREHHQHVAWLRPAGSDQQRLQTLANELLVGLGKRPDLSQLKRPAEHVAAAWLLAGAATDVVVCEAQKVPVWLLPELLTWLCGLGVRPWVVYTTVTDDDHDTTRDVNLWAAELAESWGTTVEPADVLDAEFPDVASPAKPAVHGRRSGLPVLPRCDGMVFRSLCAELLSKRDAKRVDARFVTEVRRVRGLVRDALAGPDRQKGRPLGRVVRNVLEAARDTEELVLLARAVQVGCLTEGWLARVDTVQLIGTGEALPRNGTAVTDEAWSRLAEYRDPDPGAAAALHASGLAPADIAAVTVADVESAEDGTVTVSGTPVVAGGEPFVRALAAYQLLVGGDAGTPLFTRNPKAAPTSASVHRLIRGSATEAGVLLSDPVRSKQRTVHFDWLARHGVTLEHLGNLSPGRSR